MRRTFLLALVLVLAGSTSASAQSLERISRASPFNATCGGPANGGTLYLNAEVEPWVTANPTNGNNLVAVWQQDRWSNGGAQGLLTGGGRKARPRLPLGHGRVQ